MRHLWLLIQLLGILVAGVQSLPNHWKRAPVRGTFNVDLYAFNKPRMNLARQEGGKVLPMVKLLEQLSHSSRSTMPKAHYRNLDQSIEADIEPQMNTTLKSANGNLYSNEFQSQNVGSKKIVKLNTLSDGKPVRENTIIHLHKEQPSSVHEDLKQEEPLKVKLSLPMVEETSVPPMMVISTSEKSPPKNNDDKAIIEMAIMMEANAKPNESPQNQTNNEKTDNDRDVMSTVKPTRTKSKRKQSKTKTTTKSKTKTQNEIETTMATNLKPASSTSTSPSSSSSSSSAPSSSASSSSATTSSSHVKEPAKGLATQSPEISTTHRPASTLSTRRKGSKTKTKRRGSQRRPTKEEIETTTNWWQILPYAEIRTFLNTIYDTITEDDDERAGSMVRGL